VGVVVFEFWALATAECVADRKFVKSEFKAELFQFGLGWVYEVEPKGQALCVSQLRNVVDRNFFFGEHAIAINSASLHAFILGSVGFLCSLGD
jgi:hypothetical protein